MHWQSGLEYAPVLKLSDNMEEALRMMSDIDRICATFPGLDCGSCGGAVLPALAEDVVRGEARQSDCIFVLREEIRSMAEALGAMGGRHAGEQGRGEDT